MTDIAKLVGNALDATWDIMPKKTVSFGGVHVKGIFNSVSHEDEKELEGYAPADIQTLLFKNSELPENVRAFMGDVVKVEGENWRVLKFRDGGDAGVYITFCSPKKM